MKMCFFAMAFINHAVIDETITKLNDRFSEEDLKILRAIQALTSGIYVVRSSFLNGDALAPLASKYKANMDNVGLNLIRAATVIKID